jgi:ribosome-associated translation inhibitor RaiA
MATSKKTKRTAAARARARPRKPDSARRAPLQAYIRAEQGDLSPVDRNYIRRKLGTRLGKFVDSIMRISVRTDDVNGPRGGVDRTCRIKVDLRGLPTQVYEAGAASLEAAIDGALAGIERTVRRTLQREREQPLRKRR